MAAQSTVNRDTSPRPDRIAMGSVASGVDIGPNELDGRIRILLNGKIDTTNHQGLRNTFEAVPDAPVSKFTLELKGGKKFGLLENSENLCRKTQRASVAFTAHSGAAIHLDPKIDNGCGKAKAAKPQGKKGAKGKRG